MSTTTSANRWWLTAAIGVLGVALGVAATTYLRGGQPSGPAAGSASSAWVTSGPAVIPISHDAAVRAGIAVGVAGQAMRHASLVAPGHVEANGYNLVSVKSNTNGRVTAMSAELGATVRAGQVLGEIFAPEIADQQRVYLSMRAELEAAHAKLARAERLVALGSVSQQELEATRTEHTTHETDVEGARARLVLLGVSADRITRLTSASDIVSTADMLSPIAGVVTRRTANVGQNVAPGEELVVVSDLSSVWVVADVFERDLARVHAGAAVSAGSQDTPGRTWHARVSYVDPQVAADTRTVRVRAEVANADGRLRPGQYVDVAIEDPTAASTVTVPKGAVQTIGDRHFVYVPDATGPDRFLEREVHVGASSGETIDIVSGLAAGERVVTSGSFFLRAERDRLGLPLPPRLEGDGSHLR
jgi:cobalt-zinc-cadmium efflux system membrane fusion protein